MRVQNKDRYRDKYNQIKEKYSIIISFMKRDHSKRVLDVASGGDVACSVRLERDQKKSRSAKPESPLYICPGAPTPALA